MAFFIGAANLITLFLSLEWFSIALYVMCAIDYDLEGSLEAGLKYLVVGSFGAATLLFGSALVYGATGTVSFTGIASAISSQGLTGDTFVVVGIALMVAGLGFKMSAAPFHMWTPDVYEGAPTTVTAWMSSATKVAALLLTFRVMTTAFPDNQHLWGWAFAIIATISLAIGNFAALVQKNVKRILAYSAIAQAGFMLIGLSTGSALGGRALMYYLIPYSAAAFGSFAIVAARERELGVPVTLDNLAGFGWERPFLGVAMWFFVFGFAGLPLTGGFVGKFYVFAAAYDHGWVWLVIVGVLATLVSLYYYLGDRAGDVHAARYRTGDRRRLTGTRAAAPPRGRRRVRRRRRLALRRGAADHPRAARGVFVAFLKARCKEAASSAARALVAARGAVELRPNSNELRRQPCYEGTSHELGWDSCWRSEQACCSERSSDSREAGVPRRATQSQRRRRRPRSPGRPRLESRWWRPAGLGRTTQPHSTSSGFGATRPETLASRSRVRRRRSTPRLPPTSATRFACP